MGPQISKVKDEFKFLNALIVKSRPLNKGNFELEQEVVYTVLHKFSNYETHMWSIYQNLNQDFIHNQYRHILLEISKLDTSLTLACMKILDRYKHQYESRKKRSNYSNKKTFPIL